MPHIKKFSLMFYWSNCIDISFNVSFESETKEWNVFSIWSCHLTNILNCVQCSFISRHRDYQTIQHRLLRLSFSSTFDIQSKDLNALLREFFIIVSFQAG